MTDLAKTRCWGRKEGGKCTTLYGDASARCSYWRVAVRGVGQQKACCYCYWDRRHLSTLRSSSLGMRTQREERSFFKAVCRSPSCLPFPNPENPFSIQRSESRQGGHSPLCLGPPYVPTTPTFSALDWGLRFRSWVPNLVPILWLL